MAVKDGGISGVSENSAGASHPRAPRQQPTALRLPFAFDEAKLATPAAKRTLVRRAALVKRLTGAKDAAVVSVAAPAGYGKTTLLAQWAARDRRPFAWVSLDRHDNDPVLLMTYVAAALDRVYDVDPRVFSALASPDSSMWVADVPRLLAAYATAPLPFVLVLDDVHELESRDCVDVLMALAHHVPTASHLVLSGRGDRVPIAKLRARGTLVELGYADLALDASEAHALILRNGVDASEEQARLLNERAEGWAAGIYLATLAARADYAVLAELSAFAGNDRFVADYLRSEHLSRLSRKELRFLTRSSILHRMTGPLCDAVLARGDSARILEKLEGSNDFVVPLDHRREWYRYHHLLRDLLRAELERSEPGLAVELNRRAAAWCAEHGLPEVAIDYALAAGDLESVARLVAASAFTLYRSGRVATVERWFERFDEPELLEQYPAIATLGAFVHALRGRPASAARWAQALEHPVHGGPMPDGSPSIDSWAAVVRSLLCGDGVDRMREDAQIAVEGLAPTSPWRPTAMLLLGVSTLLLGETERSDGILAEAVEAAAAGASHIAGLVALAERALLALSRGDLVAAHEYVREARASMPEQLDDYAPTALLLAVAARVAIALGDSHRARAEMAAAHRLRPQLTNALPWFSVQARLELARAHLALSDPSATRVLIVEAESLLRRNPNLGNLVPQLQDLRDRLVAISEPSAGWAATLTTAELRLLPLLSTHLSFAEIAERLHVSRNTVKTQAISVYRKLDVSSRSDAIARAADLGLIDPSVVVRSALIPSG